MPNAIEIDQLKKSFGNFQAIGGLHLSIAHGEIFGLLGPNAAGKSTLLRMLCGILSPDSGKIKLLDMDLSKHGEKMKQHIGYVAQSFALYPELTVAENLHFYAGLYGIDDQAHLQSLLETFELVAIQKQRAGNLSGGYKRRLSIACALVHNPQIIFLDEPTAGIDPFTRKELWQQFYQLSNAGKTLVVTTHYMEEAERCHQLAFLHHGKIVAQGAPEVIIASLQHYAIFQITTSGHPAWIDALKKLPQLILLNPFGHQLRIITEQDIHAEDIQNFLRPHSNETIAIQRVEPTMEDAFMTLTREAATP
ncbi:MAG: ABC transporter ATP-binding protein [Zetaproteobacteria bacterium]|nr:ABC transporter ATP-binding protein [Zetaproteobacteria bacterium]